MTNWGALWRAKTWLGSCSDMASVKDSARFKVPASKKRNPLVAPALLRKSGAHGKTEKALRREANSRVHSLLAKGAGQDKD
jgi:hypothetical protein